MNPDRHRIRLERARRWVQAAEAGQVTPAQAREALETIALQLGLPSDEIESPRQPTRGGWKSLERPLGDREGHISVVEGRPGSTKKMELA